jgi:rhamnosyltransferase
VSSAPPLSPTKRRWRAVRGPAPAASISVTHRVLPRISVIVPTLEPPDGLRELGRRLCRQTLPPDEMIAIDSESAHKPAEEYWDVMSIRRADFDHGKTRNIAARAASGDILVFMTQDALPYDDCLIERLTEQLRPPRAAACFARQIAREDASEAERVSRQLNYPAVGHERTLETDRALTSKMLFFSNVCSAVDRRAFDEVGQFPEHVLTNEDMALCGRLLRSGKTVAYCAQAAVIHSHSHGARYVFRRNFDMGAFFAMQHAELGSISVAGDGASFVWRQAAALLRSRAYASVMQATLQNIVRLAGYSMGRHGSNLPPRVAATLSLNPGYWLETRSGR